MPDVRNTDAVPDVLNGNMTISEVVEVLTHLHFGRSSRTATVELDRATAAYLIASIRQRQHRNA
jgi:hypothetical protein